MKYKLTDETKVVDGITLYRIEAVEAFGNVEVGEKGGFIEGEKNLDQYGNAWVSGNAWVYGNAQVYGNARVYGNAQVYGNARLYGNSQVNGIARVYCSAQLNGNARVYGNAQVSGNAWVYGNAQVYGNAWVYGNALVSGNAQVKTSFDYMLIGPIGSREACTTFYREKDGGMRVSCGCFGGTLDDFAAAVEKTHAENQHGKAYRAAIALVRETMEQEKG
jgi:predicted acyltransferase (DUF342 family)